MIEASCHCGAVRLQVAERPQRLTSCNCSICRRLDTLWAYYPRDQLAIVQGAGTTIPYIQGDRTLALHHCPTCGCVTHWEGLPAGDPARVAINVRLLDPAEIEGVPVRRFDGADSWTYLD